MPGKMHKGLKLLTAQVLLSSEKENFFLLRTRKLNIRKMQLSKHIYY